MAQGDAPKIFHMHIPKTAGTSVNRAFSMLYTRDQICPARYEPEFKGVSADDYTFFTGHVGYDLAASFDLPVVAVLRDPVDRFLSVYYYWQQLYREEDRREWGIRTAHALSLEEFVERFDEPSLIEEFFNRITWQFASSFHLNTRRENVHMTRSDVLARAQDNMAKCAVVGRLENLPGFVDECRRELGITLDIGRENVTAKRPRADNVSLAVRRKIRDWVEMDLELYWSAAKAAA